MEATTVAIDRRHMKAALVVAPKSDIRYYLVGMQLELGTGPQRDRVLLIATDGHRLTVSDANPEDSPNQPAQPACSVIIPRDLAERVAKHKLPRTASQTVFLRIESPGTVDSALTFTFPDGSSYAGKAIDGRYPEWRRVIRRKPGNGRAAAINPRYYGDIDAFFAALDCSNVPAGLAIDYDTEEEKQWASVVMVTRAGVNAFMAIMPMRTGTDDYAAGMATINALCETAPAVPAGWDRIEAGAEQSEPERMAA